MTLVLYHRTMIGEARGIVQRGFEDVDWDFGLQDVRTGQEAAVTGVWLADRPLGDKEGIEGNVVAVHLTTGVCQGLIPESMQMFFDMVKPGTLLENSELIINSQKMVAHCPKCNVDHELDGPVLFCPDCGSPMELIKGNEIIITSIEVDDE